MSLNHPLLSLGFTAGATITKRRIVKLGSADGVAVQAASASDALMGVATHLGANTGLVCDVHTAGVAPVEYGAAVTRGQELTSDAQGRAVPAVAGDRTIGIALESGILGTIGSVLLAPRSKELSGGLQSRSLALGHAMLTDEDGAQSFNLGAVLPANAVVLGHEVRVTEGFTDGAAGVYTLDIGIAGDVDQLADGLALANIANLGNAPGIRPTGRYGAVQLLATVLGSVNVDTATAGAATVEVFFAAP